MRGNVLAQLVIKGVEAADFVLGDRRQQRIIRINAMHTLTIRRSTVVS